ncbi:MAG: ABC transporter permease, partial [Ornithinimicrobium sp.]
MSAVLTPGVEARRQLTRLRTRWTFAILLVLPLIVVGAYALGDDDDGGARFSDLATTGSANFAIFMVFVTAELLLLIVAALFVGDPI